MVGPDQSPMCCRVKAPVWGGGYPFRLVRTFVERLRQSHYLESTWLECNLMNNCGLHIPSDDYFKEYMEKLLNPATETGIDMSQCRTHVSMPVVENAISSLGGGGDQAYSRLSTTHGHIADWKMVSVVYAGVCVAILMWTCLVWAEQSTPDNFWVPSHRFNSATGEQKGITQTIYTDSEPPSRLPNSLMPSAKLRSANLPVFYVFGVTRSRIESRPPAPRADALTTVPRVGDIVTGRTGSRQSRSP